MHLFSTMFQGLYSQYYFDFFPKQKENLQNVKSKWKPPQNPLRRHFAIDQILSALHMQTRDEILLTVV
jgi:hypothetical protein